MKPPSYTMVQTLAARLRHIHEAESPNEVLKTKPRQTTKQRHQAVIIEMHDYMHTLTLDCKYTLFGKFSTTMPKVELIRKSFIQQNQLSRGGGSTLLTTMLNIRMTIDGKLMRIQTWTPFFTQKSRHLLSLFGSYCQAYPRTATKNLSSLHHWNLWSRFYTWIQLLSKDIRKGWLGLIQKLILQNLSQTCEDWDT